MPEIPRPPQRNCSPMALTDDPLQQFQFFVAKGINRLKKEEPTAARPSKEVELLTEFCSKVRLARAG